MLTEAAWTGRHEQPLAACADRAASFVEARHPEAEHQPAEAALPTASVGAVVANGIDDCRGEASAGFVFW